MNLKQARKETRGMLTRIEKVNNYSYHAWSNELNEVVDGTGTAPSEAKLATALRQEKGLILLEVVETTTSLTMFAVDVDEFRDLAAKSGKVIFIDE